MTKKEALQVINTFVVLSGARTLGGLFPQVPRRRDRSIDAVIKRAKQRRGKPAWDPKV